MAKLHRFINLWVTKNCNYTCRYCYVEKNSKLSCIDDKKIDDFVSCILNPQNKDEEQKELELTLNFHGGEPMLRSHTIRNIVSVIDERIYGTAHYGITTNASLLTHSDIDFLAEKFDFNLSVSLDGTRQTHNLNRKSNNGRDEYDVIIGNALKLNEKSEHVRIRMTFDHHTVDTLYEDVKYLIDLGFTNIVPVADNFSREWTENSFAAAKTEYKKVMSYVESINKNINILQNEFYSLNKCNPGENYFNIDYDGNIYPCSFVVGKKQFVVGNIYDGINQSKMDSINSINDKELKQCLDCALFSFCTSTRCLMMNYAINGDFYKPNLVACNFLNINVDIVDEPRFMMQQ